MEVFKIGSDTPLGRAAERYAVKLGWRVFPVHTPGPEGTCTCGKVPCENPGKHPRTQNGLKDATGNVEQIIKWWNDWPEAGIGCPTGKVNEFFVLDIDPRHGGDISLDLLIQKYGPLPETRYHKTGGGGKHIFFIFPKELNIQNSTGLLGPGLDIRGEGGYIILPPSRHQSGGRYDMNGGDMPIYDAPEWLLKLLIEKSPESSTPQTGSTQKFKLPDKIPAGQRNDAMFRLARSLSRQDLSRESAWHVLVTENRTRCSPPLSDSELASLLDSAYSPRYEQGGYPATGTYNYPPAVSVPPVGGEPEPPRYQYDINTTPFRRDGVGNSNRFIKAYGDVLRYNTDNEQWHYWNGWVWKPVHQTFIERLGKIVVISIHQEIMFYAGTSEEKEHIKFANASNRRVEISAMVALSRGDLSVLSSKFDNVPDKINMQNGVYDLAKMEFTSHGLKEEYHSKQTGVGFDPTATCPEWISHIHKVFKGEADMIRTFQISLGYSIIGRHSEYLFVPYGSGKNGKSVTLQTIKRILGDYASDINPDTILDFGKLGRQIREDLAGLKGQRFVFTSEPNRTVSLDIKLIKRITGGDSVTADFKYGHEFTYTPQLAIWLCTNHIPKINETTEAIKSRIRLFPFEYWFKPEERKNQEEVVRYFIEKEGPGIFNWLLDGLRGFYENQNQIPFCTKVMSASDRAILENDPLERCIREVAMVGEVDAMVERRNWFHAVSTWYQDNDEGEISAKRLVGLMRDKGFEEKRKTRDRFWLGLRLKRPEEIDKTTLGKV